MMGQVGFQYMKPDIISCHLIFEFFSFFFTVFFPLFAKIYGPEKNCKTIHAPWRMARGTVAPATAVGHGDRGRVFFKNL
jgi:hypothetical protein